MFASLKALLFLGKQPQSPSAEDLAQLAVRKREVELSQDNPTLISNICSERLRGKSGGSYFKMESPPSRAPLQEAVKSLIADFGAKALPFIVPRIQGVTRIGDYADSISYSDVSDIMEIVRKSGLESEMVDALLQNIKSTGWGPQVMTAVHSFKDTRLVNPLIGYLISSGSQRSPLCHYSRKDTVGDYVLESLEAIARSNQGSVATYCLEAATDFNKVINGSRSRDSAGVQSFGDLVLEALKREGKIGERALLQIQNLLANGLITSSTLNKLNEFIDSKKDAMQGELYVRSQFQIARHQLLTGSYLNGESFETISDKLTSLDSQDAEIQDLQRCLSDLLVQVKVHSEFDLYPTAAALLPQAYERFQKDKKVDVQLVPAKLERFHEEIESSADDPSAAIAPNSPHRQRYVRYEPRDRQVRPARLVIANAA